MEAVCPPGSLSDGRCTSRSASTRLLSKVVYLNEDCCNNADDICVHMYAALMNFSQRPANKHPASSLASSPNRPRLVRRQREDLGANRFVEIAWKSDKPEQDAPAQKIKPGG